MKCETAVSVFVLDTLRYLFMYKGSNKLAYYNNERSLCASAWRVCMTMSMRKSLLCLWRDFVCLLALWIFSMWLLQVHSILTGIVFIFVWTPYVHFLVTFCWVLATVLMKGYFVSIWVGMRVNWDGCFCIKKKSSLISVFMCVCLFVERKAENFFFLNVN